MAETPTKEQVLRFKLEVVVHYLEIIDDPYSAAGADYTPKGWNLTLSQMIRLLQGEDLASAQELRRSLSNLYPNGRVRPVIES